MKFLSRFLITAICFFSASNNLFAQFVIDVPQKEFREKNGVFIAGDLSVGQTAWIDPSSVCSIGEKIFINKYTPIEEKQFDYLISAKILMEPDNSVSVTLYADKGHKKNMSDYLKRLSFNILLPCPSIVYGDNAFLRIKSINGATTITDLMTKELE
ncbi:hypothetical protein PEB0150_018060 [Bartonella apis]|uniref:hypothetical protein n=1 Tax=Bartonella apis TaxID=1686310 RepID=UPI00095C666B|nr:hypothetical protein [Bartonella apis]OLY45107.1 hypothetical protein PEB0150_018060 [Bartonella apis]